MVLLTTVFSLQSKLPLLFLFPFLEVSSKKRKRKLTVLVLLSKKEAAEPFKSQYQRLRLTPFRGVPKKTTGKSKKEGQKP